MVVSPPPTAAPLFQHGTGTSTVVPWLSSFPDDGRSLPFSATATVATTDHLNLKKPCCSSSCCARSICSGNLIRAMYSRTRLCMMRLLLLACRVFQFSSPHSASHSPYISSIVFACYARRVPLLFLSQDLSGTQRKVCPTILNIFCSSILSRIFSLGADVGARVQYPGVVR